MSSLLFLKTKVADLAYHQQEGKRPAVMFCGGFKSDMTGTKAQFLADYCNQENQSFLRFDYSGHGQSEGRFEDGTIGQWKEDTLAMLDEVAQGDVILVGSSMGAWLGLLAAFARPERIKGFIGIAAAPDFTERLIWEKLTPAQKEELLINGVFYAPSCYGEDPYPITRRLIEEARAHLIMEKEVEAPFPIHLLHGTADADVPVAVAHSLVEKFPHIKLTLIENGDHRLSSPEQLQLLKAAIDAMI